MLKEKFIIDLENTIKNNWDLPAISDYEGLTKTYNQLADRILWLHYIFEQCNIKKGDKIALIGRNSINWAISYLATISYGAVIVPILPDFRADNIQHIVNHSDAVLAFVAESIYENLDESKMQNLNAIYSLKDFSFLFHKKTNIVQIYEKSENEYLHKFGGELTPDNFKFPDIKNDDLATIVYTSGTTGFSKGVMLLHNSISANIRYAQNNMPLKPGDKILSFMPLAHSYGCAFEFLFPISLGCHITFLDKIPSPKILLKSFSEIRPQLILSVPLILEKIYKKQIEPTISKGALKQLLKLPGISKLIHKKILNKLVDVFGGKFFEIVIGGAALNSQVELFLRKIGFPITNGYGMTECGPLISYSPWNEIKARSVGRVVDTLEIKVDSDDSENIVGEILVRGENVMQGYYKNPEATKGALDKGGWLHTGDLGMIDKDGFIYLKGRVKNMILGPSGQNIYPEEIESRLNNLPFVDESLVIEKNGKLIAFVHPDYEAIDANNLDEVSIVKKMEENRKALNAILPAYSFITKIDLYAQEFEKTPTKKIKRFLYDVTQ